jgi:hypothetical protein
MADAMIEACASIIHVRLVTVRHTATICQSQALVVGRARASPTRMRIVAP